MICHKTFQEWNEDLNLVEVERQRDFIFYSLKSKRMLHVFGRYFFPHIIKGTNEVPEAHHELIDFLASVESGACIFPRGFAKTTWEKIDTLHDVIYALEPVILYISNTLQDAGFHFESMKVELENNEMLRAVYGNLVPDLRDSIKWTSIHFETTNGINVVARGAGKGRGVNIKNQRPTKIIVDDGEDDEMVRSLVRRKKYHDWLYNVIIPSLDKKKGRIKIIGTVIHPEVELLKFHQSRGGIFRKAIENGDSIWPQMWSLEDLDKLKNGYTKEDGTFVEGIGTHSFMQEYMNEPLNAELARINPAWLDDRTYTTLPENNQTHLKTVITIDPQAGEDKMADEYVITVLSWYNKDRHRYVIEQKAGHASQLDQAKYLIQTWQQHKGAHLVGIEKVMTQVAVYQLVLDWRNRKIDIDNVDGFNRNIPMIAIGPQGSMASMQHKGSDKVARMQIHEPMIERGELHLRPEMIKLRDQIIFLGTDAIEHDDRADSLIMALDLSYQGEFKKSDFSADKQQTVAGNLFKEKF